MQQYCHLFVILQLIIGLEGEQVTPSSGRPIESSSARTTVRPHADKLLSQPEERAVASTGVIPRNTPLPTSSNRSSTPIRVPDCRIVLIDHVTLASDRTGILKAVECKEGQRVNARQHLIVISDEVARASLAVAQQKCASDVEVRYHRKAHELAEFEHRKNADANKRAAEAGKGTPIAPLEVEKLRLNAEKAQLAVEQADHEWTINKLNADVALAELATHTVTAEFDGVVTRVFRKKGEAVRQGDPVVELVNTDRVRIEGRIGLAHLQYARPGGKVTVRLDLPGVDLPEEQKLFHGQITFVDLVSDPVTHETRIFAEVNNERNILRAGLMAELIIEP